MKELKIRQSPLNTITPSYRVFTMIFSVLAVVLILTILYFALSQATIYLTPNYQTQQIGFVVQVSENNPLLAISQNNEILTGSVKELTLEETKFFAAEEQQIADDKASGEVTIINRYAKDQPLIATTRLLTPDNKLYRLTETVNVPANGQVTASVMADQPGAEYEIGPAKFIIPGLWEGLRDKIYAESDADFKIVSKTQFQISQPLIDRAKNDLRNSLLNKAKEQLAKELPAGQGLPDNALVVEVIKSSTTGKIGSPRLGPPRREAGPPRREAGPPRREAGPPRREAGEAGAGQKEFSVTLGLGVKAVIFDEAKLKAIAQNSLPENYKTAGTYLKVNPNSFAYDLIILDENSEHLLAQIKGEYSIQIATVNINPALLTKLTKAEAIKKLTGLSGVKAVSVSLPFWTRYLPALPDKINIQIRD